MKIYIIFLRRRKHSADIIKIMGIFMMMPD